MSWNLISAGTTIQENQKYLVDSSGGSFTLEFPAAPSVGDEITIADGADFAQNPVTLSSSSFDFSNGTVSFVLNNTSSQFQFVFDGSQWLTYNLSRLGAKITELPSTTTQQITDNDILLYINEDSGVFESGSITYQNFKAAITDNAFTSVEEVINAINTFSGSPVLNVSLFGGNEPSFYLNYENFTNTPSIPISVSQLNNDLGFISNLSSFTTDNLSEGSTNRYFSEARFDALFQPAFEESFRLFSGDFSETQLFDSLDNVEGIPTTTSQATNVLGVSSSVIDFFLPGQNLRIFGANVDTTNITAVPTINSATKNGFAGATGVSVRYRVAQFEFSTGKISARSDQSSTITDINFELFNQINNVQISFNRASTGFGILVYRQIGSGAFSLIDVLGQKQLGSATTNIVYVDYGTFNFTPWSRKNPNTGIYEVGTGLIHFPLTAPTSPRKGWVNAIIEEVDKGANQIILTDSFNFDSSIIISQDDTQNIQATINQRVNAGINSLTLNDRRYLVSRLSIPTQFTLFGKGRASIIKKLPWSTETDNRIIRMSSAIASNVLLSNFDIDGNMQNQWLKADSFDEFANYAIDMKEGNETFNMEKVRIRNVVGGGIAARRPTSLLVNLSRAEDSGMSDFFEYSPLVADDGGDVIVTNNVFKNFTSAIDLSVTDNGVFSANAVQNVGTGVLTFASRFFISSPNVLRGPAGEFIPGPDILNSVFDSVNITLEPGTTFTSDVYKYQENGINFDLTTNRAVLDFRVDKLRKVENVEELYGEVLISGNSPIQQIFDVTLDPTEGEFKFSISSADVDELLTTFSFSTLKGSESNHIGLVYSAALTEYVSSGDITGAPTANNDEYTVTLRNFSNISLGSRVRFINHGGTPNLDNLVGTVININNTLQFANPPEITVTIKYDQNVTSVGSDGSITVENTFILAKGRIL
jgi:hypothetical protein